MAKVNMDRLAQDAANHFYDHISPNNPAWIGAFPFRSYAVRVDKIPSGCGYALGIYDKNGHFITNIAA